MVDAAIAEVDEEDEEEDEEASNIACWAGEAIHSQKVQKAPLTSVLEQLHLKFSRSFSWPYHRLP